jgi:hypothetical protein
MPTIYAIVSLISIFFSGKIENSNDSFLRKHFLLQGARDGDISGKLFIEWAEVFDLFCKLRDSVGQQSINPITSNLYTASLGRRGKEGPNID